MPEIFRYSDYRAYLKDWFEEKKKKNPAFSLRSLSKRGRSVPHSTFWMVMRGERNLTSVSLKQFISILQLEGRDALYFEALVMFNQVKGWDFKQRHLERIVEMRLALNPLDLKRLKSKAELGLYSTWYALPVLVMSELEDFKSDSAWIAKKLGADVTEAEVRAVIDELLVAGLFTLKNNRLFRVHARIEMDESILEHMTADQSPPLYFIEMSRRSADACSSLSRAELAGVAGTIMARREDIPLVRQRLNEAVTEINALLDRQPGPKELFQVSATFFPLTRTDAKNAKKSVK